VKYKVLILTSGTGSRLGELTKSKNKALVPIAGKEAIRYVIDSYPAEASFVITLGYRGDEVKKFLLSAYPKRTFEFATVNPFEGPGSSQNYSTLQAEQYLQCPFIFHACDTIIVEPIPEPSTDWLAGYDYDPSTGELEIQQYRTQVVKDRFVTKLNNKGVEGFHSIHIGLVGIRSYQNFWRIANQLYQKDPENQTIGDVPVIDAMIKEGIAFKWVPYKHWFDSGNIPALKKTETYFKIKK
jgi:hypothetical protein